MYLCAGPILICKIAKSFNLILNLSKFETKPQQISVASQLIPLWNRPPVLFCFFFQDAKASMILWEECHRSKVERKQTLPYALILYTAKCESLLNIMKAVVMRNKLLHQYICPCNIYIHACLYACIAPNMLCNMLLFFASITHVRQQRHVYLR